MENQKTQVCDPKSEFYDREFQNIIPVIGSVSVRISRIIETLMTKHFLLKASASPLNSGGEIINDIFVVIITKCRTKSNTMKTKVSTIINGIENNLIIFHPQCLYLNLPLGLRSPLNFPKTDLSQPPSNFNLLQTQ